MANMSQAEIAAALASESLQQSAVTAVFECAPEGASSCLLSEFTFFGTPVDVPSYFEEGSGTWMAALRSLGTVASEEYRKLLFIEPSTTSLQHEATFEDSSSLFDVAADLSSLEVLVVPEDGEVIIDWSELTVNGAGVPLERPRIDTLWLAHYSGLTAADLEQQLVDLETVGDGYWQMDIEGMSQASLADVVAGDEGFSGIGSEGLWLLALRCSSCRSPMPSFLTVLTPGCR
jgi:hypothetical protein